MGADRGYVFGSVQKETFWTPKDLEGKGLLTHTQIDDPSTKFIFLGFHSDNSTVNSEVELTGGLRSGPRALVVLPLRAALRCAGLGLAALRGLRRLSAGGDLRGAPRFAGDLRQLGVWQIGFVGGGQLGNRVPYPVAANWVGAFFWTARSVSGKWKLKMVDL